MKQIARSAIVEHSAAEMYALVEDIEAYPRFLPWCAAAEVHERRPGATKATLTVGPRRPAPFVHHAERKPAGRSDRHAPGGGAVPALPRRVALRRRSARTPRRIEFTLQYEFSSRTLGRLLAPLFDGIADSMVEAFVRRAAEVYES